MLMSTRRKLFSRKKRPPRRRLKPGAHAPAVDPLDRRQRAHRAPASQWLRRPSAAKYDGRSVQRIGGQPQALEVTLVAVGDVVLVGGAAVEHVVVVDELHLARLQVHVDVEVRVVGQRGRRGDGLPCRRAEPGRIGVALRGEDVLGDEPDEEASGVLGERRDRIEGPRAARPARPGCRRAAARTALRPGPAARAPGGCGSPRRWPRRRDRRCGPCAGRAGPTRSDPSVW